MIRIGDVAMREFSLNEVSYVTRIGRANSRRDDARRGEGRENVNGMQNELQNGMEDEMHRDNRV